jgi:hypothetical protein
VIARKAAEARIGTANEDVGLMAMIEGRVRAGHEYGLSAPAEGHALAHQLEGALELELRRAGLMDMLRQADPVFEREIFREWKNINNPDPGRPRSPDLQARQAAEIFSRHAETRRLMKNDAGAWIGKRDDWGGRQTHDMWKIRGAAGGRQGGTNADYAAWHDDAMKWFGEETFDGIEPAARETYLKELWNRLASGIHEQRNGADWLGGFKGPGNVAKRLSQERQIHFKDADAAFDYNQKYGKGSVLNSQLSAIDHDAHNIALMKMFSTNPESFIQSLAERLAQQALDRGDFRTADNLNWEKYIKPAVDTLIGRSNIPHNFSLAMWSATARNLETVIRLGKVFLSSFSDIPTNAATLRRNGIPYFESMARQVGSLIPGMTSAARRELGIELGAWADGILGDAHKRWRAEDSRFGTAWSQKMSDFMFKANLQNYWNDRLKTGEGIMLAARYAYNQRLSFDQLPALVRTTLDRYGIGEAEWRALRQVETRAVDGKRLLMPAEIANLPDDAVAHLGPNADRAREALHTKYGTLIDDQISEGMSDPTNQQRRLMQRLGGGAPGTVGGEVRNAMLQFKSFAATFLMRSVGRELFRGSTPMFGGRLNVDIPGLIKLMTGVTIFGAFSVMAKDLVLGKDPLERFRTPEGLHSFALQSLLQGGGFGIFGDMLFGQNSYGRGLLDVLGGPLTSTANDISKMILNLRDAEVGKIPGQAARFLQQHTPYVNLFYTDLAARHLFFYGLQEAANPGYLRRMEQRARREHEAYWLRPTEAVQY